MPYIKYEPEFIDSKLDHRKLNYPMLIEPNATLRPLSIAFSLNVIFQPKEISANFRNDKYFIGIRNATIAIDAEKGKCIKATKDSLFNVDYSVDLSKIKEVKESSNVETQGTFDPIQTKVGQEVSIGNVEEKKTTGRFNKDEKKLAAKVLNNWVQWVYALPNNDSLTSDLLDEVLILDAIFHWNVPPLKGLIQLKPGRVEVFDAERKRFPKYKYLAMIQVLIHKQILLNKKNIQINYQVY